MAIVRDAATAIINRTSGTGYAHTCTGNNVILLVAGYNGQNITAMTYNGNTMQKIIDLNPASSSSSSVYVYGILIGTADGAAHNVVITMSSGSTNAGFVSYTGVSQAALPSITDTTRFTGGATDLSLDFTTAVDDSALFGWGSGEDGAVSAGTGTTMIEFMAADNTEAIFESNPLATGTAGPKSINVHQGSSNWLYGCGCVLAPVASDGGNIVVPQLLTLGVG